MALARAIERALFTAALGVVLIHGVADPVAAVELPRRERSHAGETADHRAWRACRDHGERTLPAVEVEVAEGDGGRLAGAAVLLALQMRAQQVRAFTDLCVRAAGFADAAEGTEGARARQ